MGDIFSLPEVKNSYYTVIFKKEKCTSSFIIAPEGVGAAGVILVETTSGDKLKRLKGRSGHKPPSAVEFLDVYCFWIYPK